MAWQVSVSGPEHVLAELAHEFHEGNEPRLSGGEHGWILECSKFATLPDAEAVHSAATEMVRTLSGLIRLGLCSEAPLAVGGVSEVRPDGSRSAYVFAEAATAVALSGTISLKVTRADGTVQERRPSCGMRALFQNAMADPEMQRALRLRDAEPLSWTDLYRIYEIIEAEVGKKTLGEWAKPHDPGLFTWTANNRDAAGDQARHGRTKGTPPPKPMSLEEARHLIDTLLRLRLGDVRK